MEHFDAVQSAYNELVQSSDIYVVLSGPKQEEIINNQKAYLTRRAAYYINLRDNNYGLLKKTEGNNVMGLSVDIVLHRDGHYYDIATDADNSSVSGGRVVRPVNSDGSLDTSLIPRWVQPTKEWAGLNGVEPPPVENCEEVLAKLSEVLVNQSVMERNLASIFKLLQDYHTSDVEAIQDVQRQIQAVYDTVLIPTKFPNYKSKGWFTIVLQPEDK